eukprot:gene3992-5716_t
MNFVSKANKYQANTVHSEYEIEALLLSSKESNSLDLSGSNLSGENALFITDAILASNYNNFVHIDLSYTNISTKGYNALMYTFQNCKSLETLLLKGNDINKDHIQNISLIINNTNNLKVLDLSNNLLSDNGLVSFAMIYSQDISVYLLNKKYTSLWSLCYLNLSNNNIGDVGVLALCRGLTHFLMDISPINRQPSLKVLHLHGNRITDRGAYCISQLLNRKMNYSKTSSNNLLIQKNNNYDIYDENQQVSLSLMELGLNDNPISTYGMINLLGNPNEGIISPLRNLFLARCQPTMEVIHHLINNIESYKFNLEYIDLKFSYQSAHEMLVESSASAICQELVTSSSDTLKCISDVFKKLNSARILRSKYDHPVKLSRIDFGELPKVIFQQCLWADQNKLSTQFEDMFNALEHLNNSSDLYGIPHIGNIYTWLKSQQFDNHLCYSKDRKLPSSPPSSRLLSYITSLPSNESENKNHYAIDYELNQSNNSYYNNQSMNRLSYSSPPKSYFLDNYNMNTSNKSYPQSPFPAPMSVLDIPQKFKNNSSPLVTSKDDKLSHSSKYLIPTDDPSTILHFKYKEMNKLRGQHETIFNELSSEIQSLVNQSKEAVDQSLNNSYNPIQTPKNKLSYDINNYRTGNDGRYSNNANRSIINPMDTMQSSVVPTIPEYIGKLSPYLSPPPKAIPDLNSNIRIKHAVTFNELSNEIKSLSGLPPIIPHAPLLQQSPLANKESSFMNNNLPYNNNNSNNNSSLWNPMNNTSFTAEELYDGKDDNDNK